MQLTIQQWLNSTGDDHVMKEHGIYRPMLTFEGDMFIGSVSYESKKGLFKIIMGGDYYGTYDMQISRISNIEGLLDFLLHIHQKEWITGQHLKDFLDCFFCVVHLKTGEFLTEYVGCQWGMNKPPSKDTMSPTYAKIMAEIED